MTNPATRVCPRCGSEAHEHEYCQTCGLHLTEQPELPTRAEWEQRSGEPSGPPAAASGRPAGPASGAAAWFGQLSVPLRAVVVGGLAALVAVPIVIAASGDEDAPAPRDVAVGDPGPTAAEECVDRWNSGSSENARSLLGNLARDKRGDEVATYASAGYSADVSDRCLITVAQPDLGRDGMAYQYRETAQGTFEYPSGTSSSLTALPASVKQWNAQGDGQGNLTLGAP